jgi:hypothetical protein
MKAALQQLIDRNLPLPGMAAWGVRLADRSCESRCYSDWFTAAQIEQALNRLVPAADGLASHGIKPTRLCWVFEHTRIHLALRSDGAGLALFVENRPGVANPKAEEVLESFLLLPEV